MLLQSFAFMLAVLGVSADWTTQQWDAVVVGAGPAGIIGEFPVFLRIRAAQADNSKSPIASLKQTCRPCLSKEVVLRMALQEGTSQPVAQLG